MNPKTPEEWQAYIDSLDDEDLYYVARAAGTLKFMGLMMEEGHSADFITDIHRMFALRFAELGIEPPSRTNGCVVDYRALLQGGVLG